jgi:hypothetical protein
MFCKNCGSELKENEKFCSKCGTSATTIERGSSEDSLNSENIPGADCNRISRDTYIGKAYIFDYYIGVNLRRLRLSRRAVGFNDDNLLYCKGLNKTQIPYSMIKEIKDETKISAYVIFCILVCVLGGIIGIGAGKIFLTLMAAVLVVLSILYRNYREISIVTTDDKVFKIKTVTKNQEINEFLTYLKNETSVE